MLLYISSSKTFGTGFDLVTQSSHPFISLMLHTTQHYFVSYPLLLLHPFTFVLSILFLSHSSMSTAVWTAIGTLDTNFDSFMPVSHVMESVSCEKRVSTFPVEVEEFLLSVLTYSAEPFSKLFRILLTGKAAKLKQPSKKFIFLGRGDVVLANMGAEKLVRCSIFRSLSISYANKYLRNTSSQFSVTGATQEHFWAELSIFNRS